MALRKVAFGTAAIAGVNIARMGAQFIVVPILSRILSPSDYGLVAMAMPFVLFTMMFSDAGVGQSLVRTDHAEKSVWSTSFWLTMMLGLGLALVIVASAPIAALFFGEPRLTAIIMSLSIVVLMQAGATIPEASLRQKQRFGTIAWTEIVSILAGIGAAGHRRLSRRRRVGAHRAATRPLYQPLRPDAGHLRPAATPAFPPRRRARASDLRP